MIFLKQSTTVTLMLGPFLDDTDGKTAETALTITQADVRVSKNGGAYAQKSSTASAAHSEAGEYTCAFDATDTGTLGVLKIRVSEAGALPVWVECMVVPANVYDSLIGGTDYLEIDARQWAHQTIPTPAVTGVPKVDLTQIDGLATSTQAAILKLKQLDVQNTTGSAIIAKSSGSNGLGIDVAGNGTGAAMRLVGGSTGRGLSVDGGSCGGTGADAVYLGSAGRGLNIASANQAILATVTGSVAAVEISKTTTDGDAVKFTGFGTGAGLAVYGGATSGSCGLYAEGMGIAGAGIYAKGSLGTGLQAEGGVYGLLANNDAGGYGLYARGGEAGMVGFCTSASGHGLLLTGGGDAFHAQGGGTGSGIYTRGGYSAGSVGIRAEGFGAGGKGIHGYCALGTGMTAEGSTAGMVMTANASGSYGLNISAAGGGIYVGAESGDALRLLALGSNGHGIYAKGNGTGAGMYLEKGVGGSYDFQGATPATNLSSSAGLTAQQVRDAMALTTLATPSGNSIDSQLSGINTKLTTIDTVVDGIAIHVDDIHNDVRTINVNVSSLGSAITVVDGHILTVDSVVDLIKTDTTALVASVDSVSNKVDIVDNGVDAIVAKLPPTMISNLALSASVDGVTIEALFRKMLSMSTGRFKLNVPVAGQITFYKRDNITPEFVVQVTDTERTRISG
jgi:hypothetical protein